MKIISVTSGKGGVGKTSIVCNMASCLAKLGKKVLILDGDLGMANVDIFFGVRSNKNLQNLLDGEPVKDCIINVATNVDLLSGGSGVFELCNLNAFQRREIIAHIQDMNYIYDYLLIDTSPGLHDYVLHLNSIADECMLVLTPDPSSFTDAYALVKVLHQKYKTQKFSVICNQAQDEKAGAQLYLKFADVVQQFLPVRLSYKKTIPFDMNLKSLNQLQRLIIKQDIKTASSQAIIALCNEMVSQNNAPDAKANFAKGLDMLFRPATGHA